MIFAYDLSGDISDISDINDMHFDTIGTEIGKIFRRNSK